MGQLVKALAGKNEYLGLDTSTYVLSVFCVATFTFSVLLA